MALLAYVHGLLSSGVLIALVGDAKLGSAEVQEQTAAWGSIYVLRRKPEDDWQDFGNLVTASGQKVWWPQAYLTARHKRQTNLFAYWQVGEKETRLLATDLPTPEVTRRTCRRRMWTEELFGDLKGHGFDLESAHLVHFERLSQLTLFVVLLYVRMLWVGMRTIKRGERHWVDRYDRRDLCVPDRLAFHRQAHHQRRTPTALLETCGVAKTVGWLDGYSVVKAQTG